MDGSLARQDYTVGTTQGQAIVTKLEADWADEVPDYSAHATNLVAEFTQTDCLIQMTVLLGTTLKSLIFL